MVIEWDRVVLLICGDLSCVIICEAMGIRFVCLFALLLCFIRQVIVLKAEAKVFLGEKIYIYIYIKMSCYLFYLQIALFLLSLFLLSCTLCGDVGAASSSGDQGRSTSNVKCTDLFEPGELNNVIKSENGGDRNGNKINITNVLSPFLVAADGLMAALAEVNYTEKKEGAVDGAAKMDVVAKYIETNGNNWGNDAVKCDRWKTQMVTENKKNHENGKFAVQSSAVTVKGNKIYYMAVSNSTFKDTESPEHSATEKWHAQLVVGEVSKTEKTIKWSTKETKELFKTNKLEDKLNEKPSIIPPSDAFAVVTEDKNILFFMKGRDKDNKKNVTAFMQLTILESKAELEFLGSESYENCCLYFFQWKGKITMIPSDCKNNGANQAAVKEFNLSQKKWENSEESIFCLWGFFQDKQYFTTVTIKDNKNVLLFTQQKKTPGSNQKYDVYLWMTDGNRTAQAGKFLTDVNITSGSFQHTAGELFFIHHNQEASGPKNVTLARLKSELGNITYTLDAWKISDDAVLKLCGDNKACGTQLPINGLVGFLSDKNGGNNKEWKDEYYYVNATVTKGKKADNGGFYFNEKGSGAKWPVGKSKEDQPYNFTDPGFTLVANVTIGTVSAAQNNNSLLGVGLNDNKRVGLWCTTEGKWGVSGDEGGGSKQTSKNDCKKNREYHVALVYLNNKLSVYVDWEELKELAIQNTNTQQFKNITYFYFGADESQKDVESNVTVRNVLLYNRPFTDDEIAKLKKAKNTNMEKNDKVAKQHPKKESDDNTNGQSDVGITGGGGNSGGENTTHENTTNNNNGNSGEEEENLTSQSEVSMVRRALSLLMLSLLLLLLDVFGGGVLL